MTEQTNTTNGLEASGRGGPELFKALAEFQGTRPRAAKDGKSNFGKFATYESVLEAAQAAHGFGLSFTHIMDEDMMITILAHSSGQYLTSRMRVLADRQNAHGFGSGMSYTKRYCIAAMLGIPAVQDDDGNLAMVSTGHEHQTKKGWRKKEADAKRRASHSPDFKAGKMKGMFPALKDANIDYNMVNTWRISKGQPKLSEMPKNEADRLVGAILNKAHAARQDFDAWRVENGNG
tara:strand:+ start:46 stop:747 length:702 start_codon:yes stop_codon:yes gene_type:complete